MMLLQALTETLNDVQPFSEDKIATLKDLHAQLERKQELISNLDVKILKGTTDNTEIEAEIMQTEEINSSISTAKAKIGNASHLLLQLPLHHRGLKFTPPHHLC